jgi:flagellar hook-associated protein FlgK
MSNFNIALSGLNAAQAAFNIIGNNIANAATEGYHRQRVNLLPAYSSQQGAVLIGGGVDVKEVTRLIDNLLEQEIVRQQSALGQVLQESITLRTIENGLGELSTGKGGLSTAIDTFFNSLRDLSADPAGIIRQDQVLTDAETLAGQFRTLGEFLIALDAQIRLEVENTLDGINILTSQIAELNDKIARIEITGGNANTMSDQRDRHISDLSELIGIQTLSKEDGVVNVSTNGIGIPLVMDANNSELELAYDENAVLGISITGTSTCITGIQGGKLGGLLSLKNSIVSDISDDLDSLAGAIIQKINQYHVQGVGSEGSFAVLTGWTNASGDLADFTNITDGNMYIRVTNTTTNAITRETIAIDADSDSLTDIATAISAITGLTASVNPSNQLTISADTGYEFDFLPAVLPEPTTETLTDPIPPDIAVSGIYTGTTNSTYTCTVAGVDGQIGVTDGLKLEVEKDGTLIKELNVGLGYVAGSKLNLGDGLYISLSIESGETEGSLIVTDNFVINAWADTDTSGLLAATGINTFFSGTNALNINICSDILADHRRVATALGPDMTDNINVVRLADVRDEAISSLDSLTCGEFYSRLIADIGQQLSVKKMRQDNIEVMVLNLLNQKNEISGVDINDEAAQLLVFEQMFQAVAKHMDIINSSLSNLMEIV